MMCSWPLPAFSTSTTAPVTPPSCDSLASWTTSRSFAASASAASWALATSIASVVLALQMRIGRATCTAMTSGVPTSRSTSKKPLSTCTARQPSSSSSVIGGSKALWV